MHDGEPHVVHVGHHKDFLREDKHMVARSHLKLNSRQRIPGVPGGQSLSSRYIIPVAADGGVRGFDVYVVRQP